MKTVIMAGGRGTRISELFPNIPKPLISIDGVPILEREICSLRDQGFKDIILTVSYMAKKIIDYFGDGEKIGVHIEYFIEKTPMGNAGALFQICDKLDDDFLLLNADAAFDVDFNRFVSYYKRKGGLVTLFTHPNSHPYDSGLIIADKDGKVMQWLTKENPRPHWYKNRVNAGLHVISSRIFKFLKSNPDVFSFADGITGKIDLDRQLLKPLCLLGQVYCYDSPEYVKDMGTPKRYEDVSRDYKNKTVFAKNLKNKQRAIFLDRDGVINRYVGFLTNIDNFELLPGVSDAIKAINNAGYLAIVVTNQPVIARGDVSFPQLQEIHNKMETLLGKEGAYLNGIYFCPHHPDKGFYGEIPELKIECECRKPKPGMLLKAAKDFNIDLSKSWMIGDGKNDILAGIHAGCHTAYIGSEQLGQDKTCSSLLDFVQQMDFCKGDYQ